MTDPARPSAVPADAWWSAQDNEWILGDKDSESRLVGMVTYWRPDGSLVCKCEHVAGKPHGASRRFHETGEVAQICHFENGEIHGLRSWFMTDGTTTEKPRHENLAKNIWRGELDYVNGKILAFRYWDRDDNPVDAKGKPLPVRPANVPEGATLNARGLWTAGTWNEHGAKVGLHRFWTQDGKLDNESTHDGDRYRLVQYRDDGSRRVEYGMEGKQLVGEAAGWRRDGTPLVRATFAASSSSEPLGGDDVIAMSGATSTIEHLATDGAVVRRTAYVSAAKTETSPPAQPTRDDRFVFSLLEDDHLSGPDGATGLSLSPAGMAHAIAAGWGGGDDRDARASRAMRKLVNEIAPPSLQAAMAAQHMHRVPRMQTPLRVTGMIEALAGDPAVDVAALRDALIAGGGPATMLALADPDRALAYLRSRVSDDGRTLNLANLGLAALSPQIGRFHSVPRLYAEGNRLTAIPDEVGDMFLLSWLNLAENRIASLPRSLAWLPNLRTLYLSDNALTSIPATVFELSDLDTLSIGDNQITELPEAIGDMTALTDLSLHDNQLRDLPASLAKLPLTFLHLGHHQWEEPPAVLGDCLQLETLWISSRALKRLPAAICKLPKLERLMLWYSSVTEIPDELYQATQLQELRISNNPLPDEVYERLAEALPDTEIS